MYFVSCYIIIENMNSPSDPSVWELVCKPSHHRSATTVLAEIRHNTRQISESDGLTDEPPHSFEKRLAQLAGEL